MAGVPALLLSLGTAATVFLPARASAQFVTSAAPQATGLNGWHYSPLLTIGDTINNAGGSSYTPAGILDGIGAVEGSTVGLNSNIVRVLVNHEISAGQGTSYQVNNGSLTISGGARISYFDIDKTSRQIVGSGIAYDAIYDRSSNLVTDTNQFNDVLAKTTLDRFCSGSAFGRHSFGNGIGFEDPIYLAGEETNDGTQWALDIKNGNLWAVPRMGRGRWENWTELNTGRTDTVALLGGDDDGTSAPLYLYIGQKNAVGDGSFLDRNGLQQGKLYAWKAEGGEANPSQFQGTGSSRNGQWVELTNQGTGSGYANGWATAATLHAEAYSKGAFAFSRPEDVTTNPQDGTRAAFTSTGQANLFGGADKWGMTYVLDLDFAFTPAGELDTNASQASLKILYDGNDAGGNQFAHPDYGLRSPDNLDWADDGYLYVQEDAAFSGFCDTSGETPSVWQVNSQTGTATRIAQLVPTAGTACEQWESSGILDVTALFPTQPGEKLFLFDVQAHGLPVAPGLVEGGQLGFLATPVPEPLTLLGAGTAIGFGAFFKQELRKN